MNQHIKAKEQKAGGVPLQTRAKAAKEAGLSERQAKQSKGSMDHADEIILYMKRRRTTQRETA